MPYPLRVLRRNRGFAATAIGILALGIGLTTTVFSVVDAVLLRPLPYVDPGRLITIRSLPTRAWLDLENRSRTLQGLASYDVGYAPLVLQETSAVALRQAVVSVDFLSVLGVKPVLGRDFGSDDVRPGAEPTMMLTYGVWQQQFGGRLDAVGSLARFEADKRRIIGVLPAGFVFPIRVIEALGELRVLTPIADPAPSDSSITVIGRLRDRATLVEARAEERAIRVAVLPPGRRADAMMATVEEEMLGRSRSSLWLLFGAVGCLLLITCANVGHLFLARSLERGRELSVRRALGARTSQVMRLVVAESLVIAAIGGTLGASLAYWSAAAVVAIIPAQLPRASAIAIDGRVLAFASLVSLVVGLALGLVPAWRVSGLRLQTEMSRQSTATPGRQRLRLGIVAAEIALGVVLVAGAGLFVESFVRLTRVDVGFVPDRVLTLSVRILESRYPTVGERRQFLAAALNGLSSLPGVTAVGASDVLPVTRMKRGGAVASADDPSRPIEAEPRLISPGYLEAIGVPILRGRSIAWSDGPEREHVAVINQTLAARLWPNQDALGRRLRDTRGTLRTVVAIVGDVRGAAVDTPALPGLYVPYLQYDFVPTSLAIRSTVPASSMIAAVRERLRATDAGIPIEAVRPLDALVSASIAQPKFQAILFGLFGGCGLLLAAVGIAGVVAQAIATRTREIGIRIALGAAAAQVHRATMGPPLAAVGVGLVAGLASALWLARLARTLVYGVDPQDPWTLGGAALLLGVAAIAAAWIPGRRATRIDPIVALRTE